MASSSFSTSLTFNRFLSVKLVLLSTGVLSMALALKLTVIPLLSDFIVSEFPSICTFILTCLKPPYLYILMNFIIITIVASSKLHPNKLDHNLSTSTDFLRPVKISGDLWPAEYKYNSAARPPPVQTEYAVVYGGGNVREAESTISKVSDEEIVDGSEEEARIGVRTSLQKKENSLDLWFQNENEKPPVSARFGHRKAVKSSPEGKVALRVTKAKRHDTLESTWKTITEGRSMPLTRHLKKSDTWDSHVSRGAPLTEQNGNGATPMKKSETFSELRRNSPSLSQDELNRRVEAFINKFNEEMRLQRQESLRQYKEMINRGAH